MTHAGVNNNKEPGISGIVNNNSTKVKHYITFPTSNYWTPLDKQVEELGSSHKHATHSYVTPSLGDSNSAVFDTGATTSCGRTGDKCQPITQKSHEIFHMPTGETTAVSTQAKLYYDVCEPEKTVDMVPQLKQNSLISGGKFSDENYITVLTLTDVLIYDGNDTHISVSKGSILRGWRDTTTGLWRVPLQPNFPPPKSEFIFLENSREDAIANV